MKWTFYRAVEKKNKLGDEVENGFMDDIGEKKTIIKQNISGRFSDAKKLQRRHFSRSGRKEHQCAQNSQKNYI